MPATFATYPLLADQKLSARGFYASVREEDLRRAGSTLLMRAIAVPPCYEGITPELTQAHHVQQTEKWELRLQRRRELTNLIELWWQRHLTNSFLGDS